LNFISQSLKISRQPVDIVWLFRISSSSWKVDYCHIFFPYPDILAGIYSSIIKNISQVRIAM